MASEEEIRRLNYELLEKRVEELQPWKDAVIDALVVSFQLDEENEHDPRRALDDLANWTHKIAVDPAVSTDAIDLIKRGYTQATKEVGRRRCRIPMHRQQIRETQKICALLRANASEAWARLKLVQKDNERLAKENYDLQNQVRWMKRRWWTFWK